MAPSAPDIADCIRGCIIHQPLSTTQRATGTSHSSCQVAGKGFAGGSCAVVSYEDRHDWSMLDTHLPWPPCFPAGHQYVFLALDDAC